MSLLLALSQVSTGVAKTTALPNVSKADKKKLDAVAKAAPRGTSEKVLKRRELILSLLKQAGEEGLTRRDIEAKIPELHSNTSWYLKFLVDNRLVGIKPQKASMHTQAPRYILTEFVPAQVPA